MPPTTLDAIPETAPCAPRPAPPAHPNSLLRAGRADGRAREVFASLRGYPASASDAASARALLANYLGRLHDAGHQVLMRLVKAKVRA